MNSNYGVKINTGFSGNSSAPIKVGDLQSSTQNVPLIATKRSNIGMKDTSQNVTRFQHHLQTAMNKYS